MTYEEKIIKALEHTIKRLIKTDKLINSSWVVVNNNVFNILKMAGFKQTEKYLEFHNIHVFKSVFTDLKDNQLTYYVGEHDILTDDEFVIKNIIE